MKFPQACRALPCLVLCLLLPAGPASAESSASSAISDSITTSIGSLSTSVQKSSNSSSKGTNVAAGDYAIVEVATLADKPGALRLTLQAVADASPEGGLFLTLPAAVVQAQDLQAGRIITARPRDYGVEFANASTQQAFFLVLKDDWYRELQAHAVAL